MGKNLLEEKIIMKEKEGNKKRPGTPGHNDNLIKS